MTPTQLDLPALPDPLWIVLMDGSITSGTVYAMESHRPGGTYYRLREPDLYVTFTRNDGEAGDRYLLHPDHHILYHSEAAARTAITNVEESRRREAEERRRKQAEEQAAYEREHPEITDLVGRTITEIRATEDALAFRLEDGTIYSYEVLGDCCSESYWHDFIHPERLLNTPVLSVETVDLDDPPSTDWEFLQAYGFRFTTEDPRFGPVSSVVSFRNSSNGYYGGWCDSANSISEEAFLKMHPITGTVTDISDLTD